MITIKPDSPTLTLNETESLNLTCFVDGRPLDYGVWNQISVKKRKMSSEILTYSILPKSSITYSNFYISKLKNSDTGLYSCCLKNNQSFCKFINIIVQSKNFSLLKNFDFIFIILN